MLDILRDSISSQIEKLQNVEKTHDGQDLYEGLPKITKEKFDN